MAKHNCAICGAEVGLISDKRQTNAAKAVAGAFKAAKDGTLDETQAEATADALNAAQYGDRTEWIAKADAALAKVEK